MGTVPSLCLLFGARKDGDVSHLQTARLLHLSVLGAPVLTCVFRDLDDGLGVRHPSLLEDGDRKEAIG